MTSTDRPAPRGHVQTVLGSIAPDDLGPTLMHDGHIFANVVPRMRRRGFSEADVRTILVDNPRRLLTLDGGAR